MKKTILFLLFLVSLKNYAQKSNNLGYYIDNNGIKREGEVNSSDLTDVNDTDAYFFFKSENGKAKVLFSEVSEILTTDNQKFIRLNAQANDFSIYDNLGANPDVKLASKSLVVQVLIEGSVSLYRLASENGDKFFYKNQNEKEAVQLVFHKFMSEDGIKKENKAFQKTLYEKFNCGNKDVSELVKIKYTAADLITYFKDYLTCKNETPKMTITQVKGKESYRLYGQLGGSTWGYNAKNIENVSHESSVFAPTAGAEFEILFSKKTFAIFFGLNYADFSQESEVNYTTQSSTITNNHTEKYTVDLPYLGAQLGVRYYFFPKNNLKFFTDLYISTNLLKGEITIAETMINSGGTYVYDPERSTIDSAGVIGFGFGAEYKNISLRMNLNQSSPFFAKSFDFYFFDIKNSVTATLRYRFTL